MLIFGLEMLENKIKEYEENVAYLGTFTLMPYKGIFLMRLYDQMKQAFCLLWILGVLLFLVYGKSNNGGWVSWPR